jgi:hypothetical protein
LVKLVKSGNPNVKAQNPNGAISGGPEKRALSANGQRKMFTGCWPGSPEERYSVLQWCGHAVLQSEKEL